MQKLLLATTNKGKIQEISSFLKDLPVALVSLRDVQITTEVAETGTTYEENSRLKAVGYAKLANLPAISDDGGLEIAALGGAPGVNSRYWAGPEGLEEDNRKKMEKAAKDLPDENRNATFRTVITFALPNGKYWQTQGKIDGVITKVPSEVTEPGYPYRSFFYLPDIQKHYHDVLLTPEQVKKYNHREKAIAEIKPIIERELHV